MAEVFRVPVADDVHTLVAPVAVLDPATAAVVEQAVVAARAEGYREGEAAGRLAAVDAAQRGADAVAGALADLASEVAAQRETAARADLGLALELACEVLGRTPPDEALQVLDRIRATAELLDDDVLEVRLHPIDAEALDTAPLDARLRLVADPTVAPGDARLIGAWGGAELTRARMLAAVAELRAATDVAPVPSTPTAAPADGPDAALSAEIVQVEP